MPPVGVLVAGSPPGTSVLVVDDPVGATVVVLVDGGMSGPEPSGGSVPSGSVVVVEHAARPATAVSTSALRIARERLS